MSDSEPGGRPRPQYGEYATPEEQWAAIKQPAEWQLPEPQDDEASEADVTPTPPVPGAYHPGSGSHLGPGPQPGPGPYSGYRQPQGQAPYPAPTVPRARSGPGDRIATMVLLGFGLYNVVDMIANAVTRGAAIRNSAELLSPGQSDFVDALPDWLWIAVAVAYAVVWLVALVASIASLRANRVSFWIPLAAGVVATIVVLALTIIVVGQDPELLRIVPTPSSTPDGIGA